MSILPERPLKIGIIAGEMSGDLLGAGLIQAIRSRVEHVEFIGIGGPKMIDAGFRSLFPMDRLAVMGLVEVLGRLPELLQIRKQILKEFTDSPPDLFIGIDSPDFNLPVEAKLHDQGIKTVHYVSPTVWAWRQKRVFKIKKAVDLMLALLPFEAAFYEKFQVPVKFVGHPLANMISMDIDQASAKDHWGYSAHDRVVAVLPGSRGGELKFMGPIFIETMHQLSLMDPRIRFVAPMANEARKKQLEQQLLQRDIQLNLQLVDGHAREVMASADAVLVTSGTATLEAMLLKRPMVVAYKWGAITHAIISRMVKSEFVSLPNLLAGEGLVQEFIQENARPELLAKAVLDLLDDAAQRAKLTEKFSAIHKQLKRNANEEAAKAVLELLEYRLD